MSKSMDGRNLDRSAPGITFSEEARRFLLRVTYGRGFPPPEKKNWMPFVLWTLRTKEFDAEGSPVAESGPRYQFFAGPATNVTSEVVVDLDKGKPAAFRLDPNLRQASSYRVSLDDGRLDIQPEQAVP